MRSLDLSLPLVRLSAGSALAGMHTKTLPTGDDVKGQKENILRQTEYLSMYGAPQHL